MIDAIHIPHINSTGALMPPEDIGLAITVEIPSPHDLPDEVRTRHHPCPGMIEAIHIPRINSTGRLMSPEDVGLAITVEIPSPHDLFSLEYL